MGPVKVPQLILAILLGATMTGCIATMSQLHEPPTRAERRRACTDYVNNSASFVGQQQGFGVAMGTLAAGSLAVGAVVDNKVAKGSLLTAAVPLGYLAYNFLSNASSATTSVSGASLALAKDDENGMWAGCWRARAVYWDGRSAGIVAASEGISKSRPGTPQAREGGAYADLAASLVEQVDIDAANAKKAVADAEAKKPAAIASASARTHLLTAQTARDAVLAAAKAAKDASVLVDQASKAGDNTEAARQLEQVKSQRAPARAELDKTNAAVTTYLATK